MASKCSFTQREIIETLYKSIVISSSISIPVQMLVLYYFDKAPKTDINFILTFGPCLGMAAGMIGGGMCGLPIALPFAIFLQRKNNYNYAYWGAVGVLAGATLGWLVGAIGIVPTEKFFPLPVHIAAISLPASLMSCYYFRKSYAVVSK